MSSAQAEEKVCFVTGATGFVGLNLIDALLREKWKVYALHRQNSSRAQKIKQLDNYDPKYFCFVPGELTCDHSDFVKLVPVDVRYIFHLCHVREDVKALDRGSPTVAGFTHEGAEAHVQSNLLAMKNVLLAAEARSIKRLIYCSSWSAYGVLPAGSKVDESTISVVDQPVNHKLCCCIGVRNIPWPYGQAKLRCEELLVEHCEKDLVKSGVIIQPCTVFGRYNEGGWGQLFRIMHSSKGKMPGLSGTSSFVDVQDLANVFIAAATSGDSEKCEKYVIGGTNDTALNMQGMIGDLVGYEGPRKVIPQGVIMCLAKWNELLLHVPGFRCCRIKTKVIGSPLLVNKMTQEQTADSLKAQKQLGFKPRPLKDILQRNYDWIVREGGLGNSKES